jgi:CheY-like chemotaxis protein
VQAPVEEALDSVSELASRKGLALGYVVAPGVPDVIADEERVRQVLLNLLSNAVKYTETGQVGIHVDAALERDGVAAVTIKVCDTGIGIPEALQQRLFHWFSQIEPPGGTRVSGTGLGLAISDRLSRLLGGSIAVESLPGKGSTFTFVFRGVAADAESEDATDDEGLRGARVLAILGRGIINDQVQSCLHRWSVQMVAGAHDSAPDGRFDAVIVEADANGGALYHSLLDNRVAWRLERVPLITIARLNRAGDRAIDEPEYVVTTPVRMQALHDALRAATGRSPSAGERVNPQSPTFDGRRLAVLLVEDNESNRRVVAMMLGELGVDADEAAGGHEAIHRAAHRQYDVILMDVQMPDLDGLEATRRIRAQERDHRSTIVALTANVFESDEARCRAAGMDGYLQKPLSLDTLSAALSAASLCPPADRIDGVS